MPTTNQLIRNKRKRQRRKKDAPRLQGAPQKRGTVSVLTIMNPKKPNSAERCIVKLKLSTGRSVKAYVPGEGTGRNITEHTNLLIEGGGPPDLPGVKYSVIPGGGKLIAGSAGHPISSQHPHARNKSRSRYGLKKGKTISS